MSSSKRSSRTAAKVRFVSGPSQFVKFASIVVAIVTLGALAVLSIIGVLNTGSPAFFRAMPLLMNAMFAVLVVSVYIDQEMSDFWTALVVGVLTLLVDVVLLLFEIGRWIGPGSQIELFIVTNFAGQTNIVPIFVVIVSVLSLLGFVLLLVWMNQRREFLVFQRSIILENSQSSERQRDRQILDTLDRQREKRNRRVMASVGDASKSASMIITVIGLALLVATTVISLVVFEQAAFYRGYFLILPSLLFAAELAFFGTTPRYWIWISFVFSLLAVASCAWGAALEVPRFFDCVLSGSVPTGIIDTNVCNDDGWRGYILPWVLVLVGALSIAQAFLLLRMGNSSSIYTSRRES